MNITPRLREPFVPNPEAQEAARLEFEEIRRKREEKELLSRPLRRKILEAQGTVKDIDAALACICSCHPRVDSEQHNGGATCPCQLTPEESRAMRIKALEGLRSLGARFTGLGDKMDEEVAVAATRLGVDAKVEVGGAPFVITGTVDGRNFYLRERHGEYRIEIAPDDNLELHPWTAGNEHATLEIATGTDEDFEDGGFFSAGLALEVAVAAIRTYLQQKSCSHERAVREKFKFCDNCGLNLQ